MSDALVRSNRVALLKVLSKREQSHACMFYAEREGLRPERSKSKQNYNKSTWVGVRLKWRNGSTQLGKPPGSIGMLPRAT